MRILILGGTQFVGRHIVEALLAAGHKITILTRGISSDELSGEVERLRGDRDEGMLGLDSLKGLKWDVCVDVSGYLPGQVRPSAELLSSKVKRYVYISAISVYGDPQQRPVSETQSRVPPAKEDITEINRETYGALKVTCENIIQQIYDDKSTILRPQIVAGPYDQFDRYSYWVRRAQHGGEMLAPGDGSDHLQVIDARDLAHFVRVVISNDIGGEFNLAGMRITWTEFMKSLGTQNLVWVPTRIIKSAGVKESELPLYREEHGPRSGLMDVNNKRAIKAGLTLTNTDVTIGDIKEWLPGSKLTPALSPEQEAELIRMAREK